MSVEESSTSLVEQLKRLAASELSASAIARELSTSRYLVTRIAARHNIRLCFPNGITTKWDDARVEQLKKLASDKLSASVIAREMDTTRGSVISAAHRYKIPLLYAGSGRPKGARSAPVRKPRPSRATPTVGVTRARPNYNSGMFPRPRAAHNCAWNGCRSPAMPSKPYCDAHMAEYRSRR